MKFWKNNRLDEEFEIHPSEVLDKFLESEHYKNWLEGCNFDRCLRGFLTDKDGLSSTFENEDYEKLADYIFRNHEGRAKILKVLPLKKGVS